MKTKIAILSSLITVGLFFSFTQKDQVIIPETSDKDISSLRKIDHHAFKSGEVLQYRLHYGLINAGTATLEVQDYDKKIGGRSLYHIIGTGKSKGAFDWFFKVRDRYETYMDVEYYARTIDYKNAKVGEIFTIWSFVDDEIWPLKIRYVGKEIVKVSGTNYKAIKFHPVIQTGRLFKNEEDVTVWISDDDNKIPLMAQGKVLVGSVKMELENTKGLANPIAKVD